MAAVGRGNRCSWTCSILNLIIRERKRIHFHEWMIDVHKKLFHFQQLNDKKFKKCNTQWTASSAEAQRLSLSTSAGGGEDLVEKVADEILNNFDFICFDEFQVTFISDAVIMRRLFSFLFEKGVIIVATSNRPPGDLYLNGLNRELFVPFIPLLEKFCHVHSMDSPVDYRQLTTASDERRKVFYSPLDGETTKLLESKFYKLAKNGIDFNKVELEVQGDKS